MGYWEVFRNTLLLILLNSANEPKKSRVFSYIIAVFIVLLVVYTGVIAWSNPPISPNPNNTRIESDVDYYTPLLPQTIGIGLSPNIDKKIDLRGYFVTWSTNYGYFILVEPTINRIKYLGNTTTNHGEKIFWTYDIDGIGVMKPVVNISMEIKNQNNDLLVNFTKKIEWLKIDMAHVLN